MAAGSIRTFIAAEVDPHARRRLGELLAAVRSSIEAAGASRRIRWVLPHQGFHVTLKFLGQIDEARVDEITEVLRDLAARNAPLDLTLRGIGSFPSRGAPRVLFAAVDAGRDGLIEVAREIDGAMSSLGFPREEHGFQPHVTLARIRRGDLPKFKGLEALLPAAGRDAGPARIRELTLYRSDLKSTGSEYTALARLPFLAGG